MIEPSSRSDPDLDPAGEAHGARAPGAPPPRARMLRPAPSNAGEGPETALARPYEPCDPRERFSGPIDPKLVVLTDPLSPRAASFRLLRDALLAKGVPRVFAVASVLPEEGKTTCVANLGLVFAEQRSTRVLLVDANFFEPELGNIFALGTRPPVIPPESAPWLLPYELVEITPALHVAGLTSGATSLLGEPHRFDAMIDRLCRIAYDYIVIDTPAMRGTPGVVQLVGAADAALLAVRSGTSASDVRRATEQLPASKTLGIALVDASTPL